MRRARRFRGPLIAAITVTAVIVAGVVVTSTVAQAAGTWRQVDAGTVHTCGIQTDGSLWCWGENWGGQLGLGDTTDRARPIRVGTRTDWHTVSVGGDRSCALTTGRTIYCWGFEPNDDPTLPPRRRGTIVTTPQRVSGSGWTNVSASWGHTCAIRGGTLAAPKGELYCWGDNASGQLGTGNTSDVSSPTLVSLDRDWVRVVTTDYRSTCALRETENTLYCWGDNLGHRLGPGPAINLTRPTVVDAGYRYVAASRTICGISLTNRLYCWGSNAYGEAGLGYAGGVVIEQSRVWGTRWAMVEVGPSHACGVRTDGSGYCWGDNSSGALGRNDTIDEFEPTELYGNHRWTSIATGDGHTCGIRTDERLYCWGANARYQLGLGNTSDRYRPTLV